MDKNLSTKFIKVKIFVQNERLDKAKSLLRQAQIKVTLVRLVILRILQSAEKEWTVTEIIAYVDPKLEKISIASVYQTLRLFEKVGIVHKFKYEGEQALYSTNNNQANIRVSCQKCGCLQQLQAPMLESKLEALLLAHQVDHYQLILTRQECFSCVSKN